VPRHAVAGRRAARGAGLDIRRLTIGGVTVSGLPQPHQSWDCSQRSGGQSSSRLAVRLHGQSKKRGDAGRTRRSSSSAPITPSGWRAGVAGLGATCPANDGSTDVAALAPAKAFVRSKTLGGIDGQSIKVGRMEFIDGTEVPEGCGTRGAQTRSRSF
jgi:hypothetical protein